MIKMYDITYQTMVASQKKSCHSLMKKNTLVYKCSF